MEEELLEKENTVRKQELKNLLHVEYNFALNQLEEYLNEVLKYSSPREEEAFNTSTGGDALKNVHERSVNESEIDPTSSFSGLTRDLQLNHKTPSAPQRTNVSRSSSAPSRWESSSSQSWMDISMHMDGYLIKRALISLRLHKHFSFAKKHTNLAKFNGLNSHGVFTTQINNPAYPYVLHQLLEIHGITKDKLKDLEKWDKNDPTTTAIQAHELMRTTAGGIRRCINILCSPAEHIFPACPFDANESVQFHPPLPPDMIIQASILRDELIVAAYGVHAIDESREQSRNLLTRQNEGCIDLAGNVFRFFSFPNRTIEIIDQVLVKFSVHSLGIILDALCDAYQVSLKMKRKLDAYVELETIFASSKDAASTEAVVATVPEETQNISEWIF